MLPTLKLLGPQNITSKEIIAYEFLNKNYHYKGEIAEKQTLCALITLKNEENKNFKTLKKS